MINFCTYVYNIFGNNFCMKKYIKWSLDEEQDLINLALKCKEYKYGLKEVFSGHSKKYNRSIGAVKRRYYLMNPKGNKEDLKNALLGVVKRNNVVSIKDYQKPKITEKDLQALFRGLIKLIKESARWD